MQSYQQGDAQAFDALFHRHSLRLFRYFCQSTGDRSLAEDLTQQTWLRVHHNKQLFDITAHFRPWLYTIAANLRRDSFRQFQRGLADLSTDGDLPEFASHQAVQEDLPIAVRRALSQLPENYREVIVLHRFSELEFAEIATVLDTTPGAVKLRAFRAYILLRQLLAEWGPP